jgi:hypothetical protein
MPPSNAPPPREWTWLPTPLHPLLRGFCFHPLLLAAALLVLALAWGWVGADLGIADQFWHERPAVQVTVGLATALFFAHFCFISFLLDTQKGWPLTVEPPPHGSARWYPWAFFQAVMLVMVPKPPLEPDLPQWRRLRWYLAGTWLPLVFAFLIPVLGDPGRRWPVAAGVVFGVAVARVCVGGFNRLERPALALLGWLPHFLPGEVWLRRASGLALVLLVAVYAVAVWLSRAGRDPSANAVLYAALALLAALAVLALAVSFVRLGAMPPEERWLHTVSAFVLGLFFLACVACALTPWRNWLPPAVALYLLLGLVASVAGGVQFHFRSLHVPVLLGLLALAVLANGFPYKLRFPNLPYDPAERARLRDEDAVLIAEVAVGGPAGRARQESYESLRQHYGRLVERLDAEERRRWDAYFGGGEADGWPLPGLYAALLGFMDALEEERLGAWRDRLTRPGGRRPPLVVVTVSGGANRSSLWTAAVLAHLEREFQGWEGGPDFAAHVRLVTGASGGMVGAAHYVASLEGPGGHGFAGDAEVEDFARKAAGDSLTPLSHALVFRDLPMLFVPAESYGGDRGQVLEDALAGHMPRLGRTFGELARGECDGWRPSLVFAPMMVEDGRRLLVSNRRLHYLTESSGAFLLQPGGREPGGEGPLAAQQKTERPAKLIPFSVRDRYSRSAVELFGLFPSSREHFRVSTAVRMSASFPYVSPAVELPTEPPRRVVDAGYYDNYGVNVAASWLYRHRDWLAENTSGVLLLQVRDRAAEEQRRYLEAGTSPSPRLPRRLGTGLHWLTSPPSGASSAREAVMSFRNDEQVQVLSEHFNAGDDPEFFTTAVFECPGRIALNWYLPEEEKEKVLAGFRDDINTRALELVRRWWHREP